MSCPLHFSGLNYGFAIFCKLICPKRGASIFFKSIWHQSSPQFSTNNRAYVSATGLKQTVMKGERCLIFTESSKRTSQFEAYITLLSAFWKRKQNFWVDNKKNLSEAATDRLLEQFVTGEVDMDVGTGCGHLFTFTDIVDIGIEETFPPLWPSPIQTQYSQRDYLVHSGSWIFFGYLWIFIEYNGYFLTGYDQAPLSYSQRDYLDHPSPE